MNHRLSDSTLENSQSTNESLVTNKVFKRRLTDFDSVLSELDSNSAFSTFKIFRTVQPQQVYNALTSAFKTNTEQSISDESIMRVMNASNAIIRHDVMEFLIKWFPKWQKHGLWHYSSSVAAVKGLTATKCLQEAYNNVIKLESQMTNNPIRYRMALIILHWAYIRICTTVKSDTYDKKRKRGQGDASSAVNIVLKKAHVNWDSLSLKEQGKHRSTFHNKKRFGQRWLNLAESIGFGVLLVCGKEAVAVMYSCNPSMFSD